MKHPHLFGPVNSRRLGISLGVDLIAPKTCTLDCTYCECGQTTDLTSVQQEFISTDEIIAELDDYLGKNPALDYITFSGSGEPTLHCGLLTIITHLKKTYPQYKTALLTNATLLHIDNVMKAALLFDLVAPSMDAVTEKSFQLINRPVVDITLPRMLESLINFSHRYSGTLLLEIFIIPGINDSTEELIEFKRIVSSMKITRIQLNSLDRPGTEKSVVAATPQRLNEIAAFFSPLPVEIITRSASKTFQPVGTTEDIEEKIYSIIKRRPLTLKDLVTVTALEEQQVLDVIATLEKKGEIQRKAVENNLFFQVCI